MRVSDSDSFISEVSEEVRRERLYTFLSRWFWLIAALVLIVVGAVAVNEWRKSRAVTRAEAAGAALSQAYLAADSEARAAELAALAQAGGRGAPVVRTAEAGALIDAGDASGAGAVLAEIAESGEAAELYRALASLQRVMVLGSDMPADERLATIETLAADGAPFRPLALEQRALVHLESGDTQAAIADLEAALAAPEAPEAPEALRGRARQLIIASGGAVAPEAPAIAPGG